MSCALRPLVVASRPNEGMQRTRRKRSFHGHCGGAPADAQRYAAPRCERLEALCYALLIFASCSYVYSASPLVNPHGCNHTPEILSRRKPAVSRSCSLSAILRSRQSLIITLP